MIINAEFNEENKVLNADFGTVFTVNEGGGSITVDQTYNPKSKNAQSGIAVAEAINESVGDIETALDELHTYAQSLISGGATE